MSARPSRRAARAISTYAESPTRSSFPPTAAAETNTTSADGQIASPSSASDTSTARTDRNPTLSTSTQSRGGSTSSTRGGRGSRGGKRGGGRSQLTSPSKGNRNPKSPSDHEHESDGGADVPVQESTSAEAAAAAAGTAISLHDSTRVRSSASASAAGGIPSGQTGQALVSHIQYCLKIVGEFIDHDDSNQPGTAYGPAVDSIARLVDELLHKCKRPARFNRAAEGGATMVDQVVQADSNTPASVLQALSVIVPPPTLAFVSQLTSPLPPSSTLASMVLDAQEEAAASAARAPQNHSACKSCSCACHPGVPSSSTALALGPSSRPQVQAPSAVPMLPPSRALLDATRLVNTSGNATRGLTTQKGTGQKHDPQGAELARAGNEAQHLHGLLQSSTHSGQVDDRLEGFQASMTRRHPAHLADHYGANEQALPENWSPGTRFSHQPLDATPPWCRGSSYLLRAQLTHSRTLVAPAHASAAAGPPFPSADSTAARSSAAHRLSGIRSANAESAVAAQLIPGPLASTALPPSQLHDQPTPTIHREATSPRPDDPPAHHSGHADSPSVPDGAVARAADQHLAHQNGERIPDHSHGFDGNDQGTMSVDPNGMVADGPTESVAAVEYLPPNATGAAYHQQYDAGAIDVDQEPSEPPRKRARTSLHQGFAPGQEKEGGEASIHHGGDGPLQQPQSFGSPPTSGRADRPDPEIVRSWASLSAAFNPADPALMSMAWQNTTSASTATDPSSSYYDVQRAMHLAAATALASTSSSVSPTVGVPTSGTDLRRDSVELTAGGMSPGPDGDDGYDFSMFGPEFTEHGSPNPSQYNPDGGSMPLHMPGALDNGRLVRRRLAQFKMNALKASYAKSPYPDRMERARLCRDLGLEDKTITIWFNNQRKLHRERLRRAGFDARGRSELPALPSQSQTLPRFHSFVDPSSNTQAAAAANDHSLLFDGQSDFLSSIPSSAVDGSTDAPQVKQSQPQRFSNGAQLGASSHPYSLATPVEPLHSGSIQQSDIGSDPALDSTGDQGFPFLSTLVSPAQSDISQSSRRSHQVSDYMSPPTSYSSPIPSSQGYISVVNALPPPTLTHDSFSATRAFPSPTVGQQHGQISYPGPVAPSASFDPPHVYQGPPSQYAPMQQLDFNHSSQQPQAALVNGSGYGESPSHQSPFSPSFVSPSFQDQVYMQGAVSSDGTPSSAAASTPPKPAATPAPRSRRRSRNMSNLSNRGGVGGVSSDNQHAVPPTSPPPNIRGRWSPQELEALRQAVLRYGRDWTAIHAAHGPEGTVDQSLGRLPSVRALRQKAYRLGLHTGSDAWLNEPFSEE